VILGLQPAGLSFARSLGRRGVPVTGIALERGDFGLRSRYLRARHLVLDRDRDRRDERLLAILREAASDGLLVLFPERDQHVEFVLRRWEEVRALATVPLPDSRTPIDALRRKEALPDAAAAAGIGTPATVPLSSEEAVRGCPLSRPFLLKPLESERYAAAFSHKVVVADDLEQAVAAWRRAQSAGFELLAQELVPGSTDRILSVFTYVGRSGTPLASVVGRKVRQGPPGFGASTVFAVEFDAEVLDAGLRLLRSVEYRGFAHVEFVRDPRDGMLKLLEVNTRLPVWAGVAVRRDYDMARLAHADLSGDDVRALPPLTEPVSWVYLAKDAVTAARLARRGSLRLRELARPYTGPHVPAVRAQDDRGPALALARWLAVRAVEKILR
jgi:predicted ATP-grasp superfamily ATP-dependent carboligase